MLWAKCNTTFLRLLRVGEITVPSQVAFDDLIHLSPGDISVDSQSNASTLWFTIKQQIGVKLCLARSHSVVCPVKPFSHIWQSSWQSKEAPQDHCSSYPMAATCLDPLLSATLTQASLDDSNYNANNFHIGAVISQESGHLRNLHPSVG